jgi:hypothetical protein
MPAGWLEAGPFSLPERPARGLLSSLWISAPLIGGAGIRNVFGKQS